LVLIAAAKAPMKSIGAFLGRAIFSWPAWLCSQRPTQNAAICESQTQVLAVILEQNSLKMTVFVWVSFNDLGLTKGNDIAQERRMGKASVISNAPAPA
jgi:hypothetical protein